MSQVSGWDPKHIVTFTPARSKPFNSLYVDEWPTLTPNPDP